VLPLADGSYRNHCPFCLWSVHVDVVPGDRASDCDALMAPIGLEYRGGKGWQVVHRCVRCGAQRVNRVAGGCVQPDDIETLARLGHV
jgi:hypothetical protein